MIVHLVLSLSAVAFVVGVFWRVGGRRRANPWTPQRQRCYRLVGQTRERCGSTYFIPLVSIDAHGGPVETDMLRCVSCGTSYQMGLDERIVPADIGYTQAPSPPEDL